MGELRGALPVRQRRFGINRAGQDQLDGRFACRGRRKPREKHGSLLRTSEVLFQSKAAIHHLALPLLSEFCVDASVCCLHTGAIVFQTKPKGTLRKRTDSSEGEGLAA